MKKLLVVLAICLLTACSSGNAPIGKDRSDFRTKCLDGVRYYLFRESAGYGGYGYMAPKYNPNTKEIVTCNEY